MVKIDASHVQLEHFKMKQVSRNVKSVVLEHTKTKYIKSNAKHALLVHIRIDQDNQNVNRVNQAHTKTCLVKLCVMCVI